MRLKFLDLFTRFDWYVLGAVCILFFFGIAGLYSVSLGNENVSWFAAVRWHTIFFVIGIICMTLVARINYFTVRAYTNIFYIIGIILLVGLLFFAPEIRGIKGWFYIFGFTIQPVEFIKIIILVALAHFFTLNAQRQGSWMVLLKSGVIVGVPFILTLFQPDLGSGLVFLCLYGVFLLSLKFDPKKVLMLFVSVVLIGVISWIFLLAPYQKDRVLVLFDPSLDPLGVGYNTAQSLVAIGSGGWLGKGLGQGTQAQLNFLPEIEDDFIFSVIAEELGFLGAGLIIFSVAVIAYRLFSAANREQNLFGQYILIGYAALLCVQVFVNVGMNLGLLPVIGIPLPFVSSGGSSMIALLIGLGLVQSVIVNQKK